MVRKPAFLQHTEQQCFDSGTSGKERGQEKQVSKTSVTIKGCVSVFLKEN